MASSQALAVHPSQYINLRCVTSFKNRFSSKKQLKSFSLSKKPKNRLGVVTCTFDDFQPLRDGPTEENRPKFRRDCYYSGSSFVSIDKLQNSTTEGKRGHQKMKRKFRNSKPVKPLEAFLGCIISSLSTYMAYHMTSIALTHFHSNPLVNNFPLGLTEDMNHLVSTMIMGFGGLASGMFGITSVGLFLLGLQTFQTKK